MPMINSFHKEAIKSAKILTTVLVGGVLGSVVSKIIFGEKVIAADIIYYIVSVITLFPLVIFCKIAARQWFYRKWSSDRFD